MTFTYDTALTADRDKVRFLLQDTVSGTADLTDEEIAYLLTTYGSVAAAALAGARTLHAKYAKLVDREVGDLRVWYGQKARAWLQTIRQLESTVNALSPVEIYVGGLSKTEQDLDDEDSDLVQPRMRVGMHDMTSPLDELTAE